MYTFEFYFWTIRNCSKEHNMCVGPFDLLFSILFVWCSCSLCCWDRLLRPQTILLFHMHRSIKQIQIIQWNGNCIRFIAVKCEWHIEYECWIHRAICRTSDATLSILKRTHYLVIDAEERITKSFRFYPFRSFLVNPVYLNCFRLQRSCS